MRGNRTATAAPRPQTGFEDRPGHQALAFRVWLHGPILLHRPAVAAGEHADVAGAAGDARGVGELQPRLGVFAAGAEAIAQAGERDLALLPADGLYVLEDAIRRPARREEAAPEAHGLPPPQEQWQRGAAYAGR